MNAEYAIIVKSKTRMEALIERFNTRAQAQFYVERSGSNWSDYELEHTVFQESLAAVQKQLSTGIKNKIVDRSFLPSFIFNKDHVVVVVGQDGLVANTAKYVHEVPMIAVNPDADRYDGILLPFDPENFMTGVRQVMKNEFESKTCTLAEARMNDGQRLLAFNDLFIGPGSHTSARYAMSYEHQTEEQSSSGIIVSTKSGSSGWLSSVFNMTNGMNHFSGNRGKSESSGWPGSGFDKTNGMNSVSKKIHDLNTADLKDDQLMFVVREPFLSKHSQAGMVAGLLDHQRELTVESFMPDKGVIFSDGIESDFLNFNSGAIVTVGVAKEKAKLVLKN